MKRLAAILAAGCGVTSILVLGGCGAVTRIATEAALKKLAPGGSGAESAYVAGLKPLDSGEGLVVFEPQSAPSSAKWAELGDGCSRYLQVHVAGQGALGKTPLWGYIDDVAARFKHPDLRLDATQARQIAAPTGATRAAIGSLGGNDARLTLRYQIVDVAAGTAHVDAWPRTNWQSCDARRKITFVRTTDQ